jgi:membrane-associated phospholipid phosphatase
MGTRRNYIYKRNGNPFRTFHGILMMSLLIFVVSTFYPSENSGAQLQSYEKFEYKMIRHDIDISNQWKQSSFLTASLPDNFPQTVRQEVSSNNNAVVSWNQLITTIGLHNQIPPPYLARDYSLMHAAIYDALLHSIGKTNSNNSNKKPAEVAIVATAAAEVLAYLFPENLSSIGSLKEQQIAHIQGHNSEEIMVGRMIGYNVGKYVIEYTQTDNNSLDGQLNGRPPYGPGKWTGTNPIAPLFGHQKTYILSSGAEFQPPRPYPYGSANDLADVQAVIDAANSRTPEQIAIIHKWADLSPPTIWNNILNNEIESRNLTIYESARASAYLNTAMYDSFVSCWYTKFSYWTARPFQRISDLTFTTVIPTPNFPSYTSGHSTVSSAASLVLGQLFPEKAPYFLSQAQEAAMSRLWAGIHFPQDNNNGFAVGQQIGKKYVADMLNPPHPFVVGAR